MSGIRGSRAHGPDLALAAVIIVHYPLAILLLGDVQLEPGGYLLLVLGSIVMIFRHRAPVTVLLGTAACMLGYQVAATPGTPPGFPVGAVAALPVMVALYTALSAGARLIGSAVSMALVAGILALDFTLLAGDPTREVVQNLLALVGWLLAAAVAGEVSRQRAAYLAQVEQRVIDAERTREETARRRAGEERLRIARELHDSLTHTISIIKVQAGVAVHLARRRGEQPPEALLAIQEASREAVRELRSTLEVLRQDGEVDEPSGSGLDRLPDLVKRARSAGLPVTVTTSGDRRALPAEIDRAAYRIVQESLTNVTRHAGPALTTVRLAYQPDALLVQVDDDGLATPDVPHLPGVGLIGMRERVAAVGGTLRAEPRRDGGFSVQARLPLPSSPAASAAGANQAGFTEGAVVEGISSRDKARA